jgi:hypothetical protein
MMKAALLLASLLVSGCVSTGSAPQVDGSSSAQSSRDDDEAYRARQRCQSSSEGTESKTVCY